MSTKASAATRIDGYKLGHRKQYGPGVEGVYSNFTPRESRLPGVTDVVVFGLQYVLTKYFQEEWEDFFAADVEDVVAAYTKRVNGYLGPNNVGDEHIRALHALGYLPLEFRALPEGSLCPLRVPMLTVENTIPEFFWLTNYIETIMSCAGWLASTSATQARGMREVLAAYARLTGSPEGFVSWQGHDFSFRGMAGLEAAQTSGAGHLLFFTGTDTIPALDFIEQYYGPLPEGYLLGGSVNATEHSVMCAGGQENEIGTFDRLLDDNPTGILSVVSDTWDLWNVCTNILPARKDKITARAGKLVIRPDSGDPVKIVCGDSAAPDGHPARRGVIKLLWDVFGGTVNAKGYKVLDQHIGAIYGDSITKARAQEICANLARNGFASENIVFGVGSYTYQYVTRDTLGFAMKATWVKVDGVGKAIFKKPITGDGVKTSAKGRLAVTQSLGGTLKLVNEASPEDEAASLLRPVWRDGKFLVRETFDVIRARALATL